MNAAPAPNSHFRFKLAAVDRFTVREHWRVRAQFARGGNRPDAKTLKQRRADLDDIGNMPNVRKQGQMFWFIESDLQ